MVAKAERLNVAKTTDAFDDSVSKARSLFKAGKDEAALSAIDAALKTDPESFEACNAAVQWAIRKRNLDAFLTYSPRLVDIDPDQSGTIIATLLRFGAAGAAADMLEKALPMMNSALHSQVEETVRQLGGRFRKEPLAAARLMFMVADGSGAEDLRKQAQTMVAKAVRQGIAVMQAGDRDEALAIFKKVVEVAPDNVISLKRLIELTSVTGPVEAYARYCRQLLSVSFELPVAVKSIRKVMQVRMMLETAQLFSLLVSHGFEMQARGDESVIGYSRRIARGVNRMLLGAQGFQEEYAALVAYEAAQRIAGTDAEVKFVQGLVDLMRKRLLGTLRSAVRVRALGTLSVLMPMLMERQDFPQEDLTRAAIVLTAGDNSLGHDLLKKLENQGRCADEGLAMLGILALRAGANDQATCYNSLIVQPDGRLAQRFRTMLAGRRRILGN